jgi:O-antigen/teichoic acid export membrane protein
VISPVKNTILIKKFKNSLLRLLPKSAFTRGVSVLVGGTASAQLLLVLAAPLLSRLYSPTDFGILAVYASLLALIEVISSLRYELAIPLPEQDNEAANIAVLCLILVTLTSILTGVLTILLGDRVAIALGVPRLSEYLWLLPVGVLLTGFYTVFNYWSIRTKKFTIIAATRISQSIVMLLIQLGAFKIGGIALLLGQTLGKGVGIIRLAIPALKSIVFKEISNERVWNALVYYRRFPIFSTWGGLLNTAGAQLPVILLAFLFGPIQAGLYSLSTRVLFSPAAVIQEAISKVLFGSADLRSDKEKYSLLISKTHKYLLYISSPIAFFLFIFSPYLFKYIFGDEWEEAGIYARWLSIMFLFQFASSPLTVIFHTFHRPDLTLLSNILLFSLRLFGIVIGLFCGSALVAIIAFANLSAIGYLIFSFQTTRLAGLSALEFYLNIFRALFLGATCLLIPLLILINYDDHLMSLFVSFVILVCFYIFIYKNSFKNR